MDIIDFYFLFILITSLVMLSNVVLKTTAIYFSYLLNKISAETRQQTEILKEKNTKSIEDVGKFLTIDFLNENFIFIQKQTKKYLITGMKKFLKINRSQKKNKGYLINKNLLETNIIFNMNHNDITKFIKKSNKVVIYICLCFYLFSSLYIIDAVKNANQLTSLTDLSLYFEVNSKILLITIGILTLLKVLQLFSVDHYLTQKTSLNLQSCLNIKENLNKQGIKMKLKSPAIKSESL